MPAISAAMPAIKFHSTTTISPYNISIKESKNECGIQVEIDSTFTLSDQSIDDAIRATLLKPELTVSKEYTIASKAHQLYTQIMTGAPEKVKEAISEINKLAEEAKLVPSSIQSHYESKSKGQYVNVCVPAINGRNFTHLMVMSALNSAKKMGVPADQPILFELAKSESSYTGQPPHIFAAMVKLGYLMAGAKNQKIFIQGDHYQVDREKFWAELANSGIIDKKFAKSKLKPDGLIIELENIREAMTPEEKADYTKKVHAFLEKSPSVQAIVKLCEESLKVGYGNIDIDSSVLERENGTAYIKQEWNATVGAYLTQKIRQMEKKLGLKEPVSVGGEVGEVGKSATTPNDVRTYMKILKNELATWGNQIRGISKLAVTTGTAHGGVRDPKTGELLRVVPIRFDILDAFSKLPNPFIPGAKRMVTVQHGASTLAPELYKGFSAVGVGEVHLATEYQSIIFNIIEEKEPEVFNKMIDNLMADTSLAAIQSQKKKYKNYKTTDREKFLKDKDTRKSLGSAKGNAELIANLKPETYNEVVSKLSNLFTTQFKNLRIDKGNDPLSPADKKIAEDVIKANQSIKQVKTVASED